MLVHITDDQRTSVAKHPKVFALEAEYKSRFRRSLPYVYDEIAANHFLLDRLMTEQSGLINSAGLGDARYELLTKTLDVATKIAEQTEANVDLVIAICNYEALAGVAGNIRFIKSIEELYGATIDPIIFVEAKAAKISPNLHREVIAGAAHVAGLICDESREAQIARDAKRVASLSIDAEIEGVTEDLIHNLHFAFTGKKIHPSNVPDRTWTQTSDIPRFVKFLLEHNETDLLRLHEQLCLGSSEIQYVPEVAR